MTENLLLKLEEKMMALLAEVEDLRKEVDRLRMESSSLKMERENHGNKLQELIGLLDTVSLVNVTNPVEMMNETIAA